MLRNLLCADDPKTDVWSPRGGLGQCRRIHRVTAALLVCMAMWCADVAPASAQGVPSAGWYPVTTIPDYGSETDPPLLIADQAGTVHAFAGQWVGDDEPLMAITYNRWTRADGWTQPVDVLLSPIKTQARLLDVYLDDQGIFHLLFFGGDETESYVFYAEAPAALAGEAGGWSMPEGIVAATVPASAAIIGDGAEGLTVLVTSSVEGHGVYELHSFDGGDSWSDPAPVALTYSEKLFPYAVTAARDARGLVHVVWQHVNISGQGRGIYYARYDTPAARWTDAVDLSADATIATDLGTMTPALIIHDGVLTVFYNINGKIVMQRSSDRGRTWTQPQEIFARHLGVNGWLAPVIDSRDALHLFFGQRITGRPDIHGMWHSVMHGNSWLEPAPVVSGPQVTDMQGDKAFDPYDARAVAVQGNILLVTWRSDPGLNGNGVWFAVQETDAPALEPVPLPTVSPTVTLRPAATRTPRNFSTASSLPVTVAARTDIDPEAAPGAQPSLPLLVALAPVVTFLLVAGTWIHRRGRRTR